MDRRNPAVAAVEVLQVPQPVEIPVPQSDDRVVRSVEPLERIRQIRREVRQVVVVDVEQLEIRSVPEGQVGHVDDLVGGKMHFLQVVAPREIVVAQVSDEVVLERELLLVWYRGRRRKEVKGRNGEDDREEKKRDGRYGRKIGGRKCRKGVVAMDIYDEEIQIRLSREKKERV